MALRKSTQVQKRVPCPSGMDAASAIPVYAEHTIVAGQFAAADVLEMIPFPAGTKPVSLIAHVEDLDSNGTPTITLDFGVLSGQYGAELDDAGSARTCGTEFGDNLTTGQAGGSVVATAAQMLALAASNKDRSIGFKVETGAATLTAGAKIRVAALFLPVPQGVAIS